MIVMYSVERFCRMTKTAFLAFSVCAAPAAAADLTLTELVVNQHLKAGVPYDVALRYQGSPTGIKEVCFLWSGEGPYCWPDLRVDKKAKLIRTKARTGNPNAYTLSGFVRYGDGQTNTVSQKIYVSAK